ncbi:MAG: DUF2490 domain-containing protein [Algoriphagus sp.]|nr:DUF2490 domain-containing protein [Algoriphagus sp.]
MQIKIYFFKGTIILIFSMMMILESRAQLGRNTQEVWPAIDMFYKISDRSRLYGTASATKLEESSYSDGGIGIFYDYFTYPLKFTTNFIPERSDSLPGKFLWLRGGYMYSATPPNAEDPFKEHTIVTEANGRIYLPYKVLLTFKNRFDWRFVNSDFKGRYRPRLMLERDMKTEYLFFTASGFVEYFAYFGDNPLNRFRTQFGVEIRVTKHMNYEFFWNHQYSNSPEVQEVDAFGMTFKFYVNRGEKLIHFKKKKPDGNQASLR